MSAVPNQIWTPEEYLAFERASDQRHEYFDSKIYAMAGASANHSRITISTIGILYRQLEDGPCEVYSNDMRIKVTNTGLYTYPDISVVCDTAQFEDDVVDTLVNPTLIVEVLSSSAESYDRGKKFQLYRELESLQEYVLISQDSMRIERYLRQPNNEWLLSDVSQPDARLELSSIGCALLVADVYKKVRFETDQ